MKLNQPIGKRYPTKTSINLAMKESRKREWGKLAAAAVVLALGIAAFTKFAVVDRLTAANEAEYQAARSASQLAALQAGNVNYESVVEEYEDYNLSRSVAGLKTDTQDILTLVEGELMSMAKVESFSSSAGVITTKISGVTLNQISQIFRSLSSNPLVAHVQVFTASSNEADTDSLTTATITITLSVEAGMYFEEGESEGNGEAVPTSDGEDGIHRVGTGFSDETGGDTDADIDANTGVDTGAADTEGGQAS